MRHLIRRIPTKIRLAISFALIAIGVSASAETLGLTPDARAIRQRGRIALCESVALLASQSLSNGDLTGLETYLKALQQRSSDITSIRVLRQDQSLAIDIRSANSSATSDAAVDRVTIPFYEEGKLWGTLELEFPEEGSSYYSLSPMGRLRAAAAIFVVLASLYYLYLHRVLKMLNPSRVIPGRVRSALDALAEGVVVLDAQRRIALANSSFARTVGIASDRLLGQSIDSLAWLKGDQTEETERPWTKSEDLAEDQQWMMRLAGDSQVFDLKVSAAMIRDESGEVRGMLASFDDVTLLERQKSELRRSREAIALQNQELRLLATRDPLTSCHNRRSFFEEFDRHWERSQQAGVALGMAIVDIDFFKSINDNHGHQMGDDVLRGTGRLLLELYDEEAVVCRYGGEEFCIAFLGRDCQATYEAGERIRVALTQLDFNGLKITASIGISSMEYGATTPHELIEQADRSLYYSKRTGRNRVTRIDQVPADLDTSKEISRVKPSETAVQARLPQSAVSSLFSALAYRDPETAAHSIRVSNLTALMARQCMSLSDSYFAQLGALLHDIGKIGVPDDILLKPAPLTAAEQAVLRMHDQFGVEMVAASFRCEPLSAVIRHHHTPFQSRPGEEAEVAGTEIPLGARIVSIADAYDAIVSDRPYRRGRSHPDAVAELKRGAGTQFDPTLVEQFAQLPKEVVQREFRSGEMLDIEAIRNLGEQCDHLCAAVDAGNDEQSLTIARKMLGVAFASNAEAIARASQQLILVLESDSGNGTAKLAATSKIVDACRSSFIVILDRRNAMMPTSANRAAKAGIEPELELIEDVNHLRAELAQSLSPNRLAQPTA